MSKTKSEILFIHQSGHIGGGQTYVDNLYGAIKQKGYQVKKTENQSKTQLIRTILNTSANTIIWVIYPSFSFFIFLLSVLLRKRNILIVLGVWLLEIQSTIRYRTLLRYNLRRFIKDKVMLWKQWLICIFANQIVHLSHYAQQLFLSTSILGTLKNKPQSIIGGGVNQRQFHPISPKQRITLRQQLGIPSDNLILLATGRLEPRKNYIDAIKLLAKLRRLMPRQSILLYFVFSYGEFNEYQYFDEIIKKSQELGMSKHIHYLSGISHSEIDKFYKSADIFLMLSKKIETFGLVTLEALACGCPTFAYDVFANKEIITHKPNLFMVPLGNVDNLSKSIYIYLSFSNEEKEQLKKDLHKSIQHFTWDNAATILLTA